MAKESEQEYLSPANTMQAQVLMSGITQPAATAMAHLDSEMRSILEDSQQSPDTKMKLYNQVLQRYMSLKDRALQETAIPVKLSDVSNIGEVVAAEAKKAVEIDTQADAMIADVLKTVPMKFRRKAGILMEKIKASDIMGWDSQGHLIYKGQLIPDTSIHHLVNDFMRKRRTVMSPISWEIFATGLKQMNVPPDLIGHPERLRYMQTFARSGSSPHVTPPMGTGEEETSNLLSHLPFAQTGSGNVKWERY